MAINEEGDRRKHFRRASDREPIIEAAKEAARAVTEAGIVELTDEVRGLRKAFTEYGLLLEHRARRRWRTILVAIGLTLLIVGGQGVTLYQVGQQAPRARLAACRQSKVLEGAIIRLLEASRDDRDPSETPEEHRRHLARLDQFIEGIRTPPCKA